MQMPRSVCPGEGVGGRPGLIGAYISKEMLENSCGRLGDGVRI